MQLCFSKQGVRTTSSYFEQQLTMASTHAGTDLFIRLFCERSGFMVGAVVVVVVVVTSGETRKAYRVLTFDWKLFFMCSQTKRPNIKRKFTFFSSSKNTKAEYMIQCSNTVILNTWGLMQMKQTTKINMEHRRTSTTKKIGECARVNNECNPRC